MRRTLFVLGALALASAPALARLGARPPREEGRLAERIPLEIGGWTGTAMPLDPSVSATLETEDLCFRVYRRGGGPPVLAYFVHSVGNRKAVHPPEICLTGAGYACGPAEPVALAAEGGGAAARLRAVRGAERLLVLYWYGLGRSRSAGFVGQQLAVSLGLAGGEGGLSLVRLSTPIAPGPQGEQEADERLRAFAGVFAPAVERAEGGPESRAGGER